MQRKGITLIGFLLTQLVAYAETSWPTFHADLDTKEGHYSMWKADALAGTVGCDFEAELVGAYKHKRWASTFAFTVRGTSDDDRVSLRFLQLSRKSPFEVELITVDQAGPMSRELDLSQNIGQRLSISVRWEGGNVDFLVAERVVATVARTFDVIALEISVSTAQLKVRNLSFQRHPR